MAERDKQGRFQPGNQVSVGNHLHLRDPVTGRSMPGPNYPGSRKLQRLWYELRKAMFRACSVEDFEDIFRKAVELAKAGSVPAMHLVCGYMLPPKEHHITVDEHHSVTYSN